MVFLYQTGAASILATKEFHLSHQPAIKDAQIFIAPAAIHCANMPTVDINHETSCSCKPNIKLNWILHMSKVTT